MCIFPERATNVTTVLVPDVNQGDSYKVPDPHNLQLRRFTRSLAHFSILTGLNLKDNFATNLKY